MWISLKKPVSFAKAAMLRHFIFFHVSAPISKNTLMTFFSDLNLLQGVQRARG